MHFRRLALQGFSLEVPQTWDVVVNKGAWGSGHVVLAEGRVQTMVVTWQRSGRTADLEKTLEAAGRRLARQSDYRLAGIESGGPDLIIGRYEGPLGTCFAAAVRPRPEGLEQMAAGGELTLIVRQLVPAGREALARQAAGAQIHTGLVPWHIHGIDVGLPATWRLEGIELVVGFERAIWFRHPQPGRLDRVDAVLVMRRYACGGQLVAQAGSLAAWVRQNLARKEVVESEDQPAPGLVRIVTSQPAGTPFRRWLGQRDRRVYHAWPEPAWDRLLLQEFKGGDPLLPPLRREVSSKDAATLEEPVR